MPHVDRPEGLTLTEGVYNGDHRTHDTDLRAQTNISRVQGLIGGVNAANPLTQLDISASHIRLQSSTGLILPHITSQFTPITCNLSLAGPIINGRDQAAVFPANVWIYTYFISNGGLPLRTIASQNPPPTGPTLPATYTHWAVAAPARLNASSQLVAHDVRGNTVIYRTVQGAVGGGGATVPTGFSIGSFVPPNCLLVYTQTSAALLTNAAGTAQSLLRVFSGVAGVQAEISLTAQANQQSTGSTLGVHPNTGQFMAYQWVDVSGTAFITARQAFISILGFSFVNGDS